MEKKDGATRRAQHLIKEEVTLDDDEVQVRTNFVSVNVS